MLLTVNFSVLIARSQKFRIYFKILNIALSDQTKTNRKSNNRILAPNMGRLNQLTVAKRKVQIVILFCRDGLSNKKFTQYLYLIRRRSSQTDMDI